MKKIFSLIFTVALVSIMSTAIFAAEQPATDSSTQAPQATAEKKAQRSEFKTQVTPLREERKANREENLALREQNKALVSQIQEKLAILKTSETKLNDEQKSSLKALKAEVKTLRAEIKATQGQIKAILDANRENFKKMDFAAVQAAFNQVYEIQNFRHGKLDQINDTLGTILSSLN